MGKIKEFLKNNYKILVGIPIGVLVAFVIVKAVDTIYFASNTVSYSHLGLEATTVQGAIDELYTKTMAFECKENYAKDNVTSNNYVCKKEQNTLSVDPNGGTVLFNGENRTTLTSVTQMYGTTISLPNASKANTQSSDTYTVSYNANGGSTTPSSQTSTVTTTTSYTFNNWDTSGTCGALLGGTYTFPNSLQTTCTKTADFTSSSSSVATPITLASGAGSKTGYHFSSWQSSTDNNDYNASTSYTPTADTTMTAQWAINSNTLTLNLNGGTYSSTPSGYTKSGDDYTATKNYNQTISVTNPTKANTQASAGSYTVSYNANGGSTTPSQQSAARTTTTSYTFSSWGDSSNCGTLSSGTYTFPANNGTTCTKTANYSTSSSTTTAPVTLASGAGTKSGYRFDGWKSSTNNTVYNGGVSYTPTAATTMTAQWTELSICTRVTSTADLHTETCSQTSTSSYCSGDGYTASGSKGTTTITYGSIWNGSSALKAGDAFDCDVNNNGVIDKVNGVSTERFYYVSDRWTPGTNINTFDSNTAVLIYYKNYVSGAASDDGGAYHSSDNWHGPVTAVTHLPKTTTGTNAWRSDLLTTRSRMIYACSDAECSDTPTLTTSGGTITPNPFDYGSTTAARLLALPEVIKGCKAINGNTSLATTGSLSACNFLFEGTKYANKSKATYGPWLETPTASSLYNAWYARGNDRRVLTNAAADPDYGGVRPAIEVPKSEISQ